MKIFMKKPKSNIILTCAIVLLSALSYGYIYHLKQDIQQQRAATYQEVEETESNANSYVFPDVALFFKLLENGKKFLPAS